MTHYINEKIIRPKHIRQQFGICSKTVYNWISSGVLPKPRPIGPQMVGWFPSDLSEFYKSMDIGESNPSQEKP